MCNQVLWWWLFLSSHFDYELYESDMTESSDIWVSMLFTMWLLIERERWPLCSWQGDQPSDVEATLPLIWFFPLYIANELKLSSILFLSLLDSVTLEELHLLRITVLLVYTILLYTVFNIWDCFKQFSALLLRCLRMWNPVVQGSRSLFGFHW